MACPECDENYQRALRAEAAEQTLLLFTELFSKMSRQLHDLEIEAERRRYENNPPPLGAKPIPKRRYVLVPRDLLGGKSVEPPGERQAAE